MILEHICRLLAIRVAEQGFVSRCGALAREVEVRIGNATRTLPGAALAPFKTDDPAHLAPDARESAVTWFEAGPTRVVQNGASMTVLQNEVRLMVWLNSKRIAGELVTAEMSLVSAIRHYSHRPDSSDPVRSLEIEYQGDIPGDAVRLLSRWDFNEAEYQLTMPPFRVACHRFLITYAVGNGLCYPVPLAKNAAC